MVENSPNLVTMIANYGCWPLSTSSLTKIDLSKFGTLKT
jgi:hypothetical protein